MTQKEVLTRFTKLHDEAVANDEVKICTTILQRAMESLIAHDPSEAHEIVDIYDGLLHYNNYLTEDEARTIVTKLENSDGTKGPRWSPEELFEKVSSLGVTLEEENRYNKWSLYTEMNIVSSDHYDLLAKWSGNNRDNYAKMCYELAVSHLTDKDKPFFIRWYCDLD